MNMDIINSYYFNRMIGTIAVMLFVICGMWRIVLKKNIPLNRKLRFLVINLFVISDVIVMCISIVYKREFDIFPSLNEMESLILVIVGIMVMSILFGAYFQWGILQEYMPNLSVKYHTFATKSIIWVMRTAIVIHVYVYYELIKLIV